MNTSFWRRGGRLWVQGAVLLLLRLWQNKTGFDPATGLTVPGLPGVLLPACLVLFAALELLLALRLPAEKSAYADQFRAPDRELLLAAVAGCLLLVAGGGLLALTAVLAREMMTAVTGAMGIAAGVGLLALLRRARTGGELSCLPVLPAMLFGVLYVLVCGYIATSGDPVLARTYIPILAGALAALAFSALGGFLQKDSSPRRFVVTADLAVLLCLAAMADGSAVRAVLHLGIALTLSVFLLLRRETAAGDAPRTASGGGRRQAPGAPSRAEET